MTSRFFQTPLLAPTPQIVFNKHRDDASTELGLRPGLPAEARPGAEPGPAGPDVALVRAERRRRAVVLRRRVPVVRLRPQHQAVLVRPRCGGRARRAGARRPVHDRPAAEAAPAERRAGQVRRRPSGRAKAQTVLGVRRENAQVLFARPRIVHRAPHPLHCT